MGKRKNERAYDRRQQEYNKMILDLNKDHTKKMPRGGYETAFKRPGSRSQKHVSG